MASLESQESHCQSDARNFCSRVQRPAQLQPLEGLVVEASGPTLLLQPAAVALVFELNKNSCSEELVQDRRFVIVRWIYLEAFSLFVLVRRSLFPHPPSCQSIWTVFVTLVCCTVSPARTTSEPLKRWARLPCSVASSRSAISTVWPPLSCQVTITNPLDLIHPGCSQYSLFNSQRNPY